MNDFKDKIYARELLAKAVELLLDPQETFFVLDILSEFGDKALLAKTCEKLLNEPNLGYMKIAGYLKNINPNLAKRACCKSRRKCQNRNGNFICRSRYFGYL